MSDYNKGLPPSGFNLPPGVSIRDVDRQCQETEQPPNCPTCNGEGVVTGEDNREVTCKTCGGYGFQT